MICEELCELDKTLKPEIVYEFQVVSLKYEIVFMYSMIELKNKLCAHFGIL